MTSTYPLCWIEVKRHCNSGEDRDSSPPHQRETKAYTDLQLRQVTPSHWQMRRRSIWQHGLRVQCKQTLTWQRVCQKDTSAKPDLWHRRLGHPGETVFRRMLPLVVGQNLHVSDAHKIVACTACIQAKFNKKPSKWQLPTELPLFVSYSWRCVWTHKPTLGCISLFLYPCWCLGKSFWGLSPNYPEHGIS